MNTTFTGGRRRPWRKEKSVSEWEIGGHYSRNTTTIVFYFFYFFFFFFFWLLLNRTEHTDNIKRAIEDSEREEEEQREEKRDETKETKSENVELDRTRAEGKGASAELCGFDWCLRGRSTSSAGRDRMELHGCTRSLSEHRHLRSSGKSRRSFSFNSIHCEIFDELTITKNKKRKCVRPSALRGVRRNHRRSCRDRTQRLRRSWWTSHRMRLKEARKQSKRDDRSKRPSASTSKLMTLAELDSFSSDEDDDEHFVNLGREAAASSESFATRGQNAQFQDEDRQHLISFSGAGYSLSSPNSATAGSSNNNGKDGALTSEEAPRETIEVTVTFWKKGYSIDNGELRRMSEKKHRDFLRSLNEGLVEIKSNSKNNLSKSINSFNRSCLSFYHTVFCHWSYHLERSRQTKPALRFIWWIERRSPMCLHQPLRKVERYQMQEGITS